MVHEDYKELLIARALDALDDTDARVIDEHLGTCAECSAELTEWRDTAGLLAHGAPVVEPGAGVGKRIMDQVSSGRSARSDTGAAVVQTPPRERMPTKIWPNLLRMAAAIAFVALMIGTFILWKRDLELRMEVARLSREIRSQQSELARERDSIALLTALDAQRTELVGTDQAKKARATFAFDRETGRAILLTEGLPVTPVDKAYELWFIANGHPLPGRVFTVDTSGRATISDQVPPEARENAVFAVTLEPKAGVNSPTGSIYMSSAVARQL